MPDDRNGGKSVPAVPVETDLDWSRNKYAYTLDSLRYMSREELYELKRVSEATSGKIRDQIKEYERGLIDRPSSWRSSAEHTRRGFSRLTQNILQVLGEKRREEHLRSEAASKNGLAHAVRSVLVDRYGEEVAREIFTEAGARMRGENHEPK